MKSTFTKVGSFMFLISMLSFFTACGDDKEEPNTVSVNVPSVIFSDSGGSQSIQVTSNTNWTVSGAPSWLNVSPMQGANNGSFSVSANANTEQSSRNCTLFINAGTASAVVVVNQSPKPVSPTPTIDTDPVGSYTGTLKPMGYSDNPAKCYITLTRLSNDAVRMERLICEEFDLDMNPANLTLIRESDGRVSLQSETTKAIEGTYFQGQLTLSFTNSIATFYFSGTKNN